MTRFEALEVLSDYSKAIEESRTGEAIAIAIKGLSLWDSLNREIYKLGVDCAYDMPGFRCNNGKSYTVIPTKWHKGYQKALDDVETFVCEVWKDEIVEKFVNEVWKDG